MQDDTLIVIINVIVIICLFVCPNTIDPLIGNTMLAEKGVFFVFPFFVMQEISYLKRKTILALFNSQMTFVRFPLSEH